MALLLHPERLTLPVPVHPRLAALARKLAAAAVFDVLVSQGARTAAEQAEYFERGRTKPGPHAGEKGYPRLGLTVTQALTLKDSAHGPRRTADGLYACAVDLLFCIGNRVLEGKDAHEQAAYLALGELAELDGFVWGGRFPKRDLAHYELHNWRDFPLE